jgi:phage recombination protein Bet
MSKVTQFPTSETAEQTAPASDQKIQKETLLEYLKAFGYDKTLSKEEQNQFIQTALACDLNPFKREIHIAVYGEGANRKVSIITGYQIYLKRAERTGNLDGWGAKLEGEGQQMKAIVEIFRKDWTHSFTHEVYFEEAVSKKKDGTPTQFWLKQPRFQLRKVAMAQAFRLAFPDELGGLPYESSELPDEAVETFVKTSNSKTMEQPTKTTTQQAQSSETQSPQNTETVQEPSDQNSELTEDERNRLVKRIEDLFERNPKEFTKKHRAWILNNALNAVDKAGINKMVAYTEKVIRKAAA